MTQPTEMSPLKGTSPAALSDGKEFLGVNVLYSLSCDDSVLKRCEGSRARVAETNPAVCFMKLRHDNLFTVLFPYLQSEKFLLLYKQMSHVLYTLADYCVMDNLQLIVFWDVIF